MAKKKPDPVVHELREEEAPPSVVIRWIVPRAGGIPFAHVLVGDSLGTLCGGHRSNGAVYPPHPDVPRCPHCVAALATREAASDGK